MIQITVHNKHKDLILTYKIQAKTNEPKTAPKLIRKTKRENPKLCKRKIVAYNAIPTIELEI